MNSLNSCIIHLLFLCCCYFYCTTLLQSVVFATAILSVYLSVTHVCRYYCVRQNTFTFYFCQSDRVLFRWRRQADTLINLQQNGNRIAELFWRCEMQHGSIWSNTSYQTFRVFAIGLDICNKTIPPLINRLIDQWSSADCWPVFKIRRCVSSSTSLTGAPCAWDRLAAVAQDPVASSHRIYEGCQTSTMRCGYEHIDKQGLLMQWWMQAASKSSQGETQGGFGRQLYDTTPQENH